MVPFVHVPRENEDWINVGRACPKQRSGTNHLHTTTSAVQFGQTSSFFLFAEPCDSFSFPLTSASRHPAHRKQTVPVPVDSESFQDENQSCTQLPGYYPTQRMASRPRHEFVSSYSPVMSCCSVLCVQADKGLPRRSRPGPDSMPRKNTWAVGWVVKPDDERCKKKCPWMVYAGIRTSCMVSC